MRHHRIAVAVCLLTGSVAQAWARPPAHHGKATKKTKHHRIAPDPVAVAARDTSDGDNIVVLDAPATLHGLAAPPARDWHVAIGPYLWASSVDANVSVGGSSVASGFDFSQLEHHAKYGAEVLGEARSGRFSISGDVLYGVVGITGAKEVGPIMVALDGTASSMLLDGAAGYTLAGDDRSLLSFEARAGVRYQRTAISASVNVAGGIVAPPEIIMAGSDAVAGARVFVRPSSRLFFSAIADIGVFGASSSTWSVSVDASVRIASHVLLSLGWRTLTIDRQSSDIVMHGPRVAAQFLF